MTQLLVALSRSDHSRMFPRVFMNGSIQLRWQTATAAVLGQSIDTQVDGAAAPGTALHAANPLLRYSGGAKGAKGKGKKGSKGDGAKDRQEVGQNYICPVCGKKGEHWLQDCPTRLANFGVSLEEDGEGGLDYEAWSLEVEKRKAGSKIRFARGIPMNYLQECPTFEAACERSVDGVCYLRREKPGKYFAYVHDVSSTLFLGKHMQKLQTPVSEKLFYAYGQGLHNALQYLCCTVCGNLLNYPEIVPCCGTCFCRDCIVERRNCPACKKEVLSHRLKPHIVAKKITDKIRAAKVHELRRREENETRRREAWRAKQALVEEGLVEEERQKRAEEQRKALHMLHKKMLEDKLGKLERKIVKKRTKILDDMLGEATGTSFSSSQKKEEGEGAVDGVTAVVEGEAQQQEPADKTAAEESAPATAKAKDDAAPLEKDSGVDGKRAKEEERLRFDDEEGPPEIRNPAEFDLFKLILKKRALGSELEEFDRAEEEAHPTKGKRRDSREDSLLQQQGGSLLIPAPISGGILSPPHFLAPPVRKNVEAIAPAVVVPGTSLGQQNHPMNQQVLVPPAPNVQQPPSASGVYIRTLGAEITTTVASATSSTSVQHLPTTETEVSLAPSSAMPVLTSVRRTNSSATDMTEEEPDIYDLKEPGPFGGVQQQEMPRMGTAVPIYQQETSSSVVPPATASSNPAFIPSSSSSSSSAPVFPGNIVNGANPVAQSSSASSSSSSARVITLPSVLADAPVATTIAPHIISITASSTTRQSSLDPAGPGSVMSPEDGPAEGTPIEADAAAPGSEKKKKKRKKMTPEEFFAWQEQMRKAAEEGKPPPISPLASDT
ncbi:unnamed protein product [Amoebophrya sp. A25]|nr:unnamed protein product [Amoebophrya sp. A25]|eukprot:GSA25T00024692001.1